MQYFRLAGKQQESRGRYRREEEEQGGSGNNVLSGFDADLLAEAIGVSQETVRKLQSQNDERGDIVRVERSLRVLRPSRSEESEERSEKGERSEREESRERYSEDRVALIGNGLDEAICSMKMKENIADPMKSDIYKPNGGRITYLNSQKLPILKYIQMSANRGVLHRVSD